MQLPNNTEEIILAGGCFWCIEAVLKNVRGINSLECGYSNGKTNNPNYEQVKTGNTGHAEVVRVIFSPNLISLEQLLSIFFVIHDPCSVNKQGQDIGSQYRSAIFYTNEEQLDNINIVCNELNSSISPKHIVTKIERLQNYYRAEQYHQDYFQNNPDNVYCNLVATPKIAKFKKIFNDFIK